MPVEVREARVEDACYLARNLRQSDLVEVLALIGPHGDVARTIRQSILCSPSCATALVDGRELFVIGCAAGDNGVGVPWLLATDEVRRYPKTLTAVTKRHIAEWMTRWSHLVNAVDARSTVNVRWLQRLGFTVQAPKPLGLKGEPFHLFTMGA